MLKSRANAKLSRAEINELGARADRSGYLALGGIFFALALFRTIRSHSYSSSRLEFRVFSCRNVGPGCALVAIDSVESCEWKALLQDALLDSQNQSLRYRKGRNAPVRDEQGQISSLSHLRSRREGAKTDACEYQGLLSGRSGTPF